MRIGTCSNETELAELLRRGHWPEASSPEMRAHVAGCTTCSRHVLLTQAFARERATASAAARLDSPGALWWRAQLRRRNAALERIARPMLGAQIFAIVVALVAAALFLASQVKHGLGWFAWLAEVPRALRLQALLPASGLNWSAGAWILSALLAIFVLLSGVFAYIASDKR
jgi:hypothetical protein